VQPGVVTSMFDTAVNTLLGQVQAGLDLAAGAVKQAALH